ncbi:GNAT family N-acetyltransferase [Caldisericum sp.]|uniref:GNAT family N-acetyltransferase n=1 Tax=Caldisericum sp. TaxID=2499687 RepID=UPI00175B30EB|nr:GNAT family N-acetyltransferase [Thermodesulfobium narugense]
MFEIFIRKAQKSNFQDFYNLVYFASGKVLDSIFKDHTKDVLKALYQNEKNLYSFKHTIFIEVNGKIILKNLIKAYTKIGKVLRDEYYISNVAIYPEFRGSGLGTKLMLYAEQTASKRNLKYLSLDVERENETAINLYKKLGYKITEEKTLDLGEVFSFFRMVKEIR